MNEPNTKSPFNLHSKAFKRSIILMLLGLIVLYGIVPNLHSLLGLNLHLRLPNYWAYLVLAVPSYYLTFFISGLSYKLLSLKRLRLTQLWLVQMASSPLNLLLPAGIGNISLNYLFLRTRELSMTTSGFIVGLNNAFGIFGNVTMLILWLTIFGVNNSLLNVFGRHQQLLTFVVLLLALVVMSGILFLSSALTMARHLRRNLVKALRGYSENKRWRRLFGAYGCALLQASVTALAFWFTLKAFHINLAYPLAYLIYSLSVLVGGFFPTPGGIGGVEASLTAGIVAVHGANTSLALSAVLAYRLLSYWLPALSGSVSLLVVRRLKLIHFS